MHLVKSFLTVEQQLERLDRAVKQQWQCVLSSPLVHAIRAGYFSKELYAIYMVETYHYTAHAARNQAVAGVAHARGNPLYGKFCFDHARAKTGCEFMALRDLATLGFTLAQDRLPPPLPATETLIGYLYWIATEGHPYRRLGYSYWAESPLDFIDPLAQGVRNALGLADTQLAFFKSRADGGDAHTGEIGQFLVRTCKHHDDWDAVIEAAETSLQLTGRMIDAIYGEYEKLQSGRSLRYQPLFGTRS